MTSTESAVTEPRDQEALPRPSALRWAVAASLVAGIAVMTAVVPLLASPVDESSAGEILFFVSRLLGGYPAGWVIAVFLAVAMLRLRLAGGIVAAVVAFAGMVVVFTAVARLTGDEYLHMARWLVLALQAGAVVGAAAALRRSPHPLPRGAAAGVPVAALLVAAAVEARLYPVSAGLLALAAVLWAVIELARSPRTGWPLRAAGSAATTVALGPVFVLGS